MWESAIKTFFKDGVSRFSEGQVEPFEDFLYNKIPLVLRSTAPIVVWHEQDEATKKYKYEFRLSFDNVTYMKPRIQEATGRLKQMLPYEARVRNFTYAAQMFVDIKFTARSYSGPLLTEMTEQSKVFEGISIGKIPVMLGSSLCILKDFPVPLSELGECSGDPFGYFVVHGSERIILSQEKVADNRSMVFFNKKTASKFTHSVEMKSLHESFTMPPKKVEIRIQSKFNGLGFPLTICIPRFKEDIPLMVFFRALGILSDKEIYDLMDDSVDDYMAASFKEAADMNIFTEDTAIEYLTHHLQYPSMNEDKHGHIRGLLLSEFLPHVNLAAETLPHSVVISRKILILSSMLKKLIQTATGKRKIDDRDSYPNKRVVTTGALLTHLFRQLFQKVCKDIRSKLVHEINNDSWKRSGKPLEALTLSNLYKILKVSSIEGKMKQALATGNFTVQGLGTSNSTALSNATKSGVSQVLNRMSYSATLSHVRRIQTPVEKSGKLLAPRKLHGTSWGFVCPVETPEGHAVGIVKTMSLMTTVSSHTPSLVITNILKTMPRVRWVSNIGSTGEVAILLNGVIVAHTESPVEVHSTLRKAKLSCSIHPHISISWQILNKQIMVETDAGRLVRPVFRVEKGKLLEAPKDTTNWNEWIKTCVEYIDPAESEVVRIAMMPDEITTAHTHCEIHPQMILGHMASTIPLSDHNQSPRNTYQSAMGKQAVCLYASNYQMRLDKNAYVLCSSQRPLVETKMTRILNMQNMPFGENAIVAIACYSGYNQEDSVLLNRNSLKRGFMRGLYYSLYKDEEHRNVVSGREERFAKPRQESTRGYKNTSYHAVGENGIPIRNAIVQENDVVIGKVVNMRSDPHGYQFKDLSTTHKSGEPCRIDGIWQNKNSDGYPFVKVRVVSERIPQIGDKVSSRHGQKGTVGMILDECDMPFTSSGLRPDIIMNPHAVPSRMTIAQLLETMYGRIGTRKGTIGDGTPYSHLKMEELSRQMEELGLHPYGNEIMYNGMTGEMMEVEIFVGSTFYQRLKHMVIDKKHCLTDDHDVLTTEGWKPINDVTKDDLVATLQSGNVVYEHPLQTFAYDYEGDMYELSSQQVSLKATPNHRMWVGTCHTRKQEWRFGFHEAKDIIGKHVKYQKDGHWEKDDYSFVLPALGDEEERPLDMDAWLTFLGIWIGDGWCNRSKKNQVEIAANKPRVKNALDICLPELGFQYTYYPSDKKLHVKSRQLAAYMGPLSVGATNKTLPDWIWELSQRQCQKFMSGLMLSDGHSTGCGKMVYSTSSDKLADDIQRLALHAGWSANKRLHTKAGTPYTIGSHSGVTTSNLWSMRIITTKNRPAVNHGHHQHQNGQKEGMVPFVGKVYCLEVPGNIFYVRRNGCPVWTGNSRARGPIVSLTRQPCEGRSRDGGLRVGEMERDCMLTHGASIFTKERLMDVSDPFETGICRACGSLAMINERDSIYECRVCSSKVGLETKTIPYAVKLWLQELEAMHISPRMMFGKE